ncbi:unnamed protein product, partial [Owenia fusiformis]
MDLLQINDPRVFLIPLVLLVAVIAAPQSGPAAAGLSDTVPMATTQAPGGYVRVDFVMKNMTKYTGESLRLRCEITGDPAPRYRWFRNEVSLKNEDMGGRINIKRTHWGSRLRLDNLQMDDAGTFACQGLNQYGRKSTSGQLTILPGPNPNAKPDLDDPNLGDSDNSEFDDTYGIDYYKEHLPDTPDTGWNGGIYDTGMYGEEARQMEGFCQPYKGAACHKFLANKSIYVTSKVQQKQIDERLATAYSVIAQSSDLSANCAKYAIPSLCFNAFPLCDNSGPKPKPKKICREECVALEDTICKNEFLIASANPLIADKIILPKCDILPLPGTPEAANCLSVGALGPSRNLDIRHTCYNGTGNTYRGTVSHTLSGYECQKWNENSPHNPMSFFQTSSFPELGDHNYCRNPGNREDAPWCFTRNPNVPRELCSIPKCSEVKGSEGVSEIIMILVPCIAVPLALALLLFIICMCKRNKQALKDKTAKRSNGNMELSPLTSKQSLRSTEYPMSCIRFLQELGEGAFGKVYKGELIGYPSEHAITKVAIKTVKDNAASKTQTDFKKEIDLMEDLKHPNIVCLIGVCLREEPHCMLFEFMAHGDLHEYLQTHSPHSDVSISDDDTTPHVLDQSDMFYIANQVAAGMEYLATHHFVHRDLACRNILVGENVTVKISDFGLSRDIYSSDYYRVQSKSLLPVRWMPPEAILYGKFSVESDIWSYGVVLWEIFSYGLQPYYGFSNQEVIEMIRARQVLPCPDDCPSRMYTLMIECWHEVAGRRPHFREINTRLRHWRGESLAVHNHVAHSQSGHSSSAPSSHHSTGPSNNTQTSQITNQSLGHRPMPTTIPPPTQPPVNPYQLLQQHQMMQQQMMQ